MKNIKEIWGYSHDGHIVVKDIVTGKFIQYGGFVEIEDIELVCPN